MRERPWPRPVEREAGHEMRVLQEQRLSSKRCAACPAASSRQLENLLGDC